MSTSRPGRIAAAWDRLANRPGGRWLFSAYLGRTVPYTGSIRPQVVELGTGHARVAMADRRAVRNHLGSVHAIAITNLAEVASGLALHYALPPHARAILIGMSIEFTKKGRGRLEAESTSPVPDGDERVELTLETVVRDQSGDTVARASAHWLISPPDESARS